MTRRPFPLLLITRKNRIIKVPAGRTGVLSAAQALLQQGIEQLGLQLSAQQQQQLMAYLALFAKWNRAYNLSAIRDLEQMVRLHLLDSLAIVPHISGERLIDVGTGGGLPVFPWPFVTRKPPSRCWIPPVKPVFISGENRFKSC